MVLADLTTETPCAIPTVPFIPERAAANMDGAEIPQHIAELVASQVALRRLALS